MSSPESIPAVRSRRFPKLRRRLIVLGVLAVAYVLAGFFVVPPVVRAQAEKRLSKALSRPVSILKVRFNPLTFSCEVTGFEVRDPKGGDFFGWRRLSANFDPLKRLLGAWTFKEIELDGFHANIQRDASGHLNFADLVAKQAETSPGTPHSPSKPLPAVSIGHVAVTDARLHFEDAGVPTPFSTDLGPLTFSLRNFTTSREATAPYSFSATSETGENLSWTGTLEPEALRSSGEFALTNLKLPKYAPYYEGLVRFKLRSGDLSVKAHYDFTLAEASPDMRLSNGSVTVQSLELTATNASEPHIRVNDISATDIEADLKSRKVAIGELHLAGGTIEANRKPDGIDLIGLMLPKGQPDPLQSAVVPPAEAGVSSASTATQEAQAPWSLTVKQIDVARFDALLTDRTLETPAKFQIRNLTSHLAPLRIHRLDELSHVDLKFDLEGGGEVSIRGNAAIHPLAANLTVSIQQLPVAQINPYLQSRIPLHVDKGLLALAGEVSVAGNAATFKGKSSIDTFDLRDAITRSPIASWSVLTFEGMDVATQPLKADIQHVLWKDLQARASISREGKFNLSAMAPGKPAPETPPAESAPPASTAPTSNRTSLPPLTIGRLTLDQAGFSFQDDSLQPAATSGISRLSGTIEGLSSESLGRGSIRLKGVVNDTAPVEISGQLNPLGSPATADVKLDFKDIELSPLGPYIAKYTGHTFEKGALSLAIGFKLDNRTIDSSDVVTLEQFTLGESNGSADALKLPITLAIALLKDSSGQIVIDVPVQGSLDDPSFRIGRVVWRVISNLLAKAATSPFALLGSMFGGGGEELAFQKFEPGVTTPLDSESGKLATVAKALANRPSLKLDLAGGFDPVADRIALQRARVESEIRSEFSGVRDTVADTQVGGDTVMSQANRDLTVARLFAAAFPDLVSPAPEPVAPQPAPAVEESPRSPGFIARVRRFFSGSGQEAPPPPQSTAVTAASPSPAPTPAFPAPSFTTDEMITRPPDRRASAENDLFTLANARAQHLRGALLQSGEVAPERVFVVSPVATGSRVELRLK